MKLVLVSFLCFLAFGASYAEEDKEAPKQDAIAETENVGSPEEYEDKNDDTALEKEENDYRPTLKKKDPVRWGRWLTCRRRCQNWTQTLCNSCLHAFGRRRRRINLGRRRGLRRRRSLRRRHLSRRRYYVYRRRRRFRFFWGKK